MGQVKPWLCRSYPLNTANHLLHVIKISLTRVISHAFWQMWLAGCDMTKHGLLPLCQLPWGLVFPARPLLPLPRLAFQLTCSRWAAQWEDTGTGRCVYFPETMLCCCRWWCLGANGSLWQHCHTARASRQTELAALGDGEIGEKNKIEDVNQFLDFRYN